MRVSLKVTAGPLAGKMFNFDDHDVFLVGRSPKAHLRLPEDDPYFSRGHFLIEVNPPKLRLMDMGSLNGTFVNGKKVTAVELHDGDEIKAGHTFLSVHVERDPNQPAATLNFGEARETQADIYLPATPSQAGTNTSPGGDSSVVNFNIPPDAATPRLSAPLTPVINVQQSDSNIMGHFGGPPKIPGYELRKLVGYGNMGAVYLANRESDGAEVALKTILPNEADNPQTIQRFVREAEVLQQLNHPNIVKFYETGSAGRVLFFAMEYVRGTDVNKVLLDRPRVELRTAIRLAIQVLDALGHAHAKGMVHRDIKPANVLLAELPDGRRQVKLADFGLARVYRASSLSGVTLHGDLGGTPAYMPPEQITNYREVMPAADQYSTAAMLYHMLTGKWIFDLPPMPAGLMHIMHKDPIPLRSRRADLPPELETVIHRALAKQPGDRYADVTVFRQALLPFGK